MDSYLSAMYMPLKAIQIRSNTNYRFRKVSFIAFRRFQFRSRTALRMSSF